LGALGQSCDGLGKLAVFGAARSRSYAKLFCKIYSIVFFVHFGRGELYLEMMLQDKPVNLCRAILRALASGYVEQLEGFGQSCLICRQDAGSTF
jgi:hypothetical protein